MTFTFNQLHHISFPIKWFPAIKKSILKIQVTRGVVNGNLYFQYCFQVGNQLKMQKWRIGKNVTNMYIMKTMHLMQNKIENLEKEVASLKQRNSQQQDVSSQIQSSTQNVSVSDAVNEALDIERRKFNLVINEMPVLRGKIQNNVNFCCSFNIRRFI